MRMAWELNSVRRAVTLGIAMALACPSPWAWASIRVDADELRPKATQGSNAEQDIARDLGQAAGGSGAASASLAAGARPALTENDRFLLREPLAQLERNRSDGTPELLRELVEDLYTGRISRADAMRRMEQELGIPGSLAFANAERIIRPTLMPDSARQPSALANLPIKNPIVLDFISEEAARAGAANVVVVRPEDEARLLKEAVEAGEVIDLGNGTYYARSNSRDVARTEERTFVATSDPKDAGILNHWAPAYSFARLAEINGTTVEGIYQTLREAGYSQARIDQLAKDYPEGIVAKVRAFQAGAPKAETLYVIPYMTALPGSPLAPYALGIEVTDSRYVALNLIKMTRMGQDALEAIENVKLQQDFVRGVHVTGDLENIRRGSLQAGFSDEVDDRYFVTVADERRLLHYGSAYGGNALLPKIAGGLRQANYDASKNGFLVEQFMIMGIKDKQTGETRYIAGGFPSASGKTNLVMMKPPKELADRYEVQFIGDDIVWFYVGDDGRLYGMNPENGVFGVAPDTNEQSNPNAIASIGPGSGAIFTNTAFNPVTKEVWWEGKTPDYPEDLRGWLDWQGKPITERDTADQRNKNVPWAHPNSRFTVSLDRVPNLHPEANTNAKGFPIDAIIFGGRVTSGREPLIRRLGSPQEGLYDGFLMGVEATAAADGLAGVLRGDPLAMRPFVGIAEREWMGNWLAVLEKLGPNAPMFGHVNWFAKSADGKYLWPGYGQNLHALLWLLDQGEGVATPVGQVPTAEALSRYGLSVPRATLRQLLSYDTAAWQAEVARRTEFLNDYATQLPSEFQQEHRKFVAAQVTAALSRNPEIRGAVERYAKGQFGATEQANFAGLTKALEAAGVPSSLVNAFRGRAVEVATGKAPELPIDPITGAVVHRVRFDSVGAIARRLDPYVRYTVDEQGRTRVEVRPGEYEALKPLFADLAYDAVLNEDTVVRDAARWMIRELAPHFGVQTASLHDYYEAVRAGEITGRTLPAFNVRWRGLDMVRSIYRAAKAEQAGAFILEIAASEEGYTGKGHDYAGMAAESLAAAVLEGYTGPVFLKMDHTQISASNYKKDPAKELAALKAKITRGLEAGFLNVDLDTSTIEAEPRYVELEVTEWFLKELRAGRFDLTFAPEQKAAHEAAFTIGDDVVFNPARLDEALSAIARKQPQTLSGARFSWGDALGAGAALADLKAQSLRSDLQYKWDQAQQAESIKAYLELAEHTRATAARLYGEMPIALGAEVGEVGKKYNTTISQVKAFLNGVTEGLAARGIEGPNVFSIQTGTAHGGQRDAEGNLIRDVAVDWELHKQVAALPIPPEQHGFSTVAEAKLSRLPEYNVGEVHLATEYANMLLYGIIFGEPIMAGHQVYVERGTTLTDDVKRKLVQGSIGDAPEDEAARQALFDSIEVVEYPGASATLRNAVLSALQPLVAKEGLVEENAELTQEALEVIKKNSKFKDVVKKVAHDQMVLEIMWNLPAPLATAIGDAWQTKFVETFKRVNASDTYELVLDYGEYPDEDLGVPTPSLALARAMAAAEVRIETRAPAKPAAHSGKQNTTSIAALIADPVAGFRGKGKEAKSAADKAAKAASDAVTADQGLRAKVHAFEGSLDVALGDLEEGSDAFHTEGTIVNPKGFGPEVPMIEDVVEGTTATATNNSGVSRFDLPESESGGTSIRATGAGIGSLGIIPDMYALSIFTKVPPEKRDEVQAALDPLVADEANPYEGVKATLTMIAEANGISLDALEVVVLKRPRENARLAALARLQEEHPGLTVTTITDGTVAPGIDAVLGRKEGKHLVMWTTAKTTETFYNLAVARTAQSRGAVGAARIATFGIGKEGVETLAGWSAFDDVEQRKISNGRPHDAGAVLSGVRIITPKDAMGAIEASMSLITDNGWFGLAGAREVRPGVQRVTTLRFSDPDGQGDGYAWVDVDDVSVAQVQQVIARGTFALQEPAAADASIVDDADTLLSLMDSDVPRLIEVHAGIAAHTPGFFIAWERALERFRARKGLATLEEAASASPLDVALYVDEGTDVPAMLAAIAAASKGAVAPQAGWFTVVTDPLEAPYVAIGPKAWIQEESYGARVKVAVEAPVSPPDGQPVTVASGAAALYAGVTAAANDGKLPPDVAAKLEVLEEGGFLAVTPASAVTAEVESVLRDYQTAVRATEVGV